MGVNNLPRVGAPAGSRTHDLSIISQTLHHQATCKQKTWDIRWLSAVCVPLELQKYLI